MVRVGTGVRRNGRPGQIEVVELDVEWNQRRPGWVLEHSVGVDDFASFADRLPYARIQSANEFRPEVASGGLQKECTGAGMGIVGSMRPNACDRNDSTPN